MLHGFEDGVFGNFVKDNALDGDTVEHVSLQEFLAHMPGNSLAFPVGVSYQIKVIIALGGFGDGIYMLLGSLADLPNHGEIVIRVDRAIFCRQVAHMAIARQHRKPAAEILVYCLGLSWGLDDYNVHLTT